MPDLVLLSTIKYEHLLTKLYLLFKFQMVREPMSYQQILLLLESGAFVGDEDTESGVDIFEQAVLMCIANIKDMFHLAIIIILNLI